MMRPTPRLYPATVYRYTHADDDGSEKIVLLAVATISEHYATLFRG
jgi:hypothetical protein